MQKSGEKDTVRRGQQKKPAWLATSPSDYDDNEPSEQEELDEVDELDSGGDEEEYQGSDDEESSDGDVVVRPPETSLMCSDASHRSCSHPKARVRVLNSRAMPGPKEVVLRATTMQ